MAHSVTQDLRTSDRNKKPSERMKEFQVQEAEKQTSKFTKMYAAFKTELVETRQALKTECSEDKLYSLIDNVQAKYEKLPKVYETLRTYAAHIPVKDLTSFQRRMDSAAACKSDIISYLNQRVSQIGVLEFNLEEEDFHLKNLKASYAASVYSAATRCSQGSEHSRQSGKSIKDQVVEAEAELAAKQVRLKSLEVSEKERTRLAELEAQRSQQNLKLEQEIECQRQKLELLQAQHDVEEINARCIVLKAAASDDDSDDAVFEDELVNNSRTFNHADTLNAAAEPFRPISRSLSDKGTCLPIVASQSMNETSFAQAIANAMTQSRLPVPVPKIFSGNPIEFVTFKTSFKTLIEDKGISPREKIYYLQQYVDGEAKDAIEGCFYGTTENEYIEAWRTLESRYGNPFKIQEAFRMRLESWPKVEPKNGIALRKYADFLKCCLDAIPHIKGLSILNDWKENQKLVAKLPDWAVMRWSRKVSDVLDSTAEYPTFNEFVTFVAKEAQIVCNPVMSLAAVRGLELSHDMRVFKEKSQDAKGRGTAFSIEVNEGHHRNTNAEAQGVHKGVSLIETESCEAEGSSSFRTNRTEEHRKICPFCNGDHYLSSCVEFSNKDISERNAFVQSQRRCFGCLRIGHVSKNCSMRHICRRCKGRHPTVLHDSNREKKSENSTTQQDEEQRSVVSLSTDHGHSGNHGHSGTTNVVPVWVSSSDNPNVEKLVYALLDTQSDSTFIEERVCEELSVSAEPVKLKLTTLLGKDVDVASKRVRGLRVRGYMTGQYIDLPITYTQDSIPLDREHISTRETASKWSHLVSIVPEMPPLMDCEVGLLIGYNCSAALIPRQVITGDRVGQPYAIKTDLGWSIVGTVDDRVDAVGFCHRVRVKEVPAITPCDVLKV